LREHFCDGLGAGLKADPEAFAATKPRTMMGLMVRELVCEAAHARCDAIKLVFAYVDAAESLHNETDTDEAGDNSQGILEPEALDDTRWDWDETGWDSSERVKKPGELDAERAAHSEAMRQDLRERILRLGEATRENEARTTRLAAESAGQTTPTPPPAPFSGNSAPNLNGSIRIGGKLVEG
jgi:hypothetical protein